MLGLGLALGFGLGLAILGIERRPGRDGDGARLREGPVLCAAEGAGGHLVRVRVMIKVRIRVRVRVRARVS